MGRAIRIGMILLTFGLAGAVVYFFYGTMVCDVLISDRMSEFVDAVDRHHAKKERKLVIFDLDDTVFMSSKLVGTPTWFYNMINILRQGGAAKYEAYGVVSAVDKIVQEKIRVVPVEQATLSAIRTWQKLGMMVIALTSRHKDLGEITKHQLDQIGLDFSSPMFSCVENAWKGDRSFVDGVLFAGNNLSKGLIFARFLDQLNDCGLEFDLIAQADDQQRYVAEVAKIAKKNRIDFIGVIYGGALASRVFDFAEAKKQLLDLEANLQTTIVPDEYRRIFMDENG